MIGPAGPANGGTGSGGEIGGVEGTRGGASGGGGWRFEKGGTWTNGREGCGFTIIRRGRCNARGPFGATDGDVDLGRGI